jgi:hypothetical protein
MRGLHLRIVTLLLFAAFVAGACSNLGLNAPDDKAIVSGIQAQLFQDATLKTRDIKVDSQKGVVVLTGSVASDAEKASVESIANQQKGVKQVIDELSIAQVAAPQQPPATEEAQATTPPEPVKKKHQAVRHKRQAQPSSETASNESTPAPQPPAVEPPAAAAPVAQPAPPPPPPPPQPIHLTVPSGTVISVRMIDGIDSARNRPGEEFAASLTSAVVAGDRVVFPQGSDARVRLVEARTSGRMQGSSELQLELTSITANGTPYEIQSGYYDVKGQSRGKRTAETVGGGAVLGGLIGAIAGRGKGAAIGAGVGAAAGAGVEAAGHGQQVKIPSETKIDFTLKSPVSVTVNP